jgi:hypothetical protein
MSCRDSAEGIVGGHKPAKAGSLTKPKARTEKRVNRRDPR